MVEHIKNLINEAESIIAKHTGKFIQKSNFPLKTPLIFNENF